jgi:hypothetical protein
VPLVLFDVPLMGVCLACCRFVRCAAALSGAAAAFSCLPWLSVTAVDTVGFGAGTVACPSVLRPATCYPPLAYP